MLEMLNGVPDLRNFTKAAVPAAGAMRMAPRAVVLRDSLILYKAVIYPHNRRV
jgi:hypothetical protein